MSLLDEHWCPKDAVFPCPHPRCQRGIDGVRLVVPLISSKLIMDRTVYERIIVTASSGRSWYEWKKQ